MPLSPSEAILVEVVIALFPANGMFVIQREGEQSCLLVLQEDHSVRRLGDYCEQHKKTLHDLQNHGVSIMCAVRESTEGFRTGVLSPVLAQAHVWNMHILQLSCVPHE